MKRYYSKNKRHYRKNYSRNNKNIRSHPSLVVGENDNKFINIGLTHSPKRGHHKNIRIHNPLNFNEISYLRNDVSETDKDKLKIILSEYKIHHDDYEKILEIISKYEKKPPLGGSH